MNRIWSDELLAHVGERARLLGWLHRFRELGAVGFALVRDARGLAQVVVHSGPAAEALRSLAPESAIEVEATVVENLQAPGGLELIDSQISVVSAAVAPPPFQEGRLRVPVR
jgi:nondiscriminating aspartyl-tRNA synthetase